MTEPSKAPRWAWWLATGLGSGYLKPAPGTWGSLAGLVVWVILSLGIARLPWRSAAEGLFLALPILLTWAAISAANKVVRENGQHDPSYIVADEWVGMWIALWGLRWEILSQLPKPGWKLALALALPFCLFRIFDIWKPWPIFQAQSLPEGQGIVADDLVAGFYALVLGQILIQLVL